MPDTRKENVSGGTPVSVDIAKTFGAFHRRRKGGGGRKSAVDSSASIQPIVAVDGSGKKLALLITRASATSYTELAPANLQPLISVVSVVSLPNAESLELTSCFMTETKHNASGFAKYIVFTTDADIVYRSVCVFRF